MLIIQFVWCVSKEISRRINYYVSAKCWGHRNLTCRHPRAQGLSGSAEHIALDVEMWKRAVLINWSCCGDAGPLPLPLPGEQCIDKMIISVHNIHTDQPSSGKATKLIWIVFQISNYELNTGHQTKRSSHIQTVIDLQQTFPGHAISQFCYNFLINKLACIFISYTKGSAKKICQIKCL